VYGQVPPVTCSPPKYLQIITKQSISSGEMCVEWAGDHLVLVWCMV